MAEHPPEPKVPPVAHAPEPAPPAVTGADAEVRPSGPPIRRAAEAVDDPDALAHVYPPSVCGPAPAVERCFVPIPAGTVWVGAQADDPTAPAYDHLAAPHEGPVRQVELPAFSIQEFETTVAEVRSCGAAGPCADFAGRYADIRADRPAVGLSFAEAEAVCGWMEAEVPDAAHWIRAARGAEAWRFPWGDGPSCPLTTGGSSRHFDAHMEQAASVCPGFLDVAPQQVDEATQQEVSRATPLITADMVAAVCPQLSTDPAAATAAFVELLRAEVARQRFEGDLSALVDICSLAQVPRVVEFPTDRGFPVRGMSSGVAEWTTERWSEDDPRRVVRGGSFTEQDPRMWRVAARQARDEGYQGEEVGVRCVRPGTK